MNKRKINEPLKRFEGVVYFDLEGAVTYTTWIPFNLLMRLFLLLWTFLKRPFRILDHAHEVAYWREQTRQAMAKDKITRAEMQSVENAYGELLNNYGALQKRMVDLMAGRLKTAGAKIKKNEAVYLNTDDGKIYPKKD